MIGMTERRAGAELRLQGRTLYGAAMRYGDVAPGILERFEAGAFSPVPAVPLNLQHDSSMVILEAGAYELRDTPEALIVRAELPEDSAAIKLVRRGALGGFSVEFLSKREVRADGVRVIQSADLMALGLVDVPAYTASRVEVRARLGRTMRASVPTGRKLCCECMKTSTGRAQVRFAKFQRDAMQKVFRESFDEAVAIIKRREIVATHGSYGQPLASVSKGTLRGRMTKAGLEVDIDLPDDQAGRAVLAANDSAGVVVRPFVNADAAEFTLADDVAEYSEAPVRAFIVSATDAREGWPQPKILPTPDDVMERSATRERRFRAWL